MILNKNSDIINFDLKNIPIKEMESINIPYYLKPRMIMGVVKIDGEYYYAKSINDKKMLNELIGTYLSKYIGLDTVDYKIGIYNGSMYALSKLFYEEGV